MGIDRRIVLNHSAGSGDSLRDAHVGATVNHLRALANDIHSSHLPTLMHIVWNPTTDMPAADMPTTTSMPTAADMPTATSMPTAATSAP